MQALFSDLGKCVQTVKCMWIGRWCNGALILHFVRILYTWLSHLYAYDSAHISHIVFTWIWQGFHTRSFNRFEHHLNMIWSMFDYYPNIIIWPPSVVQASSSVTTMPPSRLPEPQACYSHNRYTFTSIKYQKLQQLNRNPGGNLEPMQNQLACCSFRSGPTPQYRFFCCWHHFQDFNSRRVCPNKGTLSSRRPLKQCINGSLKTAIISATGYCLRRQALPKAYAKFHSGAQSLQGPLKGLKIIKLICPKPLNLYFQNHFRFWIIWEGQVLI